MENFSVDKRAMSLVYDLVTQQPRKKLRGTGAWPTFWSNYPIKMATYQNLQKGKLWRILANHSRVPGSICPHQVRLTIPVAYCVEAYTSFRFKVEELRPCACANGAEANDNSEGSEDEADDGDGNQAGGGGEDKQAGGGSDKQNQEEADAALARDRRRKKLAEKVQKANESAEIYDADEEVPLADKFEARIKQYRVAVTVCKDADLLRRFFALKVPYTSIIPLQPEPAVQFNYTAEVLEGFQALDELFYADVTSYMKSAEPKLVMTEGMSPSKRLGQHLAAGFEALDREFYSIIDVTATSDDDETAASEDGSATAIGGGSVTVDPQNALLSLLGGDSDGGPMAKRARPSWAAFRQNCTRFDTTYDLYDECAFPEC